MYPLPSEMIFNFHFKKMITILYYYMKSNILVAFWYLKKNLVNWTDSEHLYTVNFDNLFIYYLEGGHTFININKN